jgi:hypothetical protein
MDIVKIARIVAAERPLEIRLQEMLDEAKSSGKPVSIESKYGRLQEFNSQVKRVDATPEGKIGFFDKAGKSLGQFSMSDLFGDY